jgi:hypothetical protein
MDAVTFANGLGRMLAPLLLAIRETGFFEWWVYVPTMTLLALAAYAGFLRRARRHGVPRHPSVLSRLATHLLHISVCVVGANALAVAFKTLIVEEMDYAQPVWFAGLVSPLHFYIASVAACYLTVVTGPATSRHARLQGVYAELGLFAFCTVGIHRLHTQSFSLLDPTMAVGGALILAASVRGMIEVWGRMPRTRQPAN